MSPQVSPLSPPPCAAAVDRDAVASATVGLPGPAPAVLASAALRLVTVILPTYNERENIAAAIAAIERILDGLVAYEVLVVDDNSADGTARLVAELAVTRPNLRLVERAGKRGLASAIVDGFACARGDVLVVMDADLQHDEAALPEMLSRVVDHGLVVGSRYVDGGSTGAWCRRRSLLSRLGVGVCRRVTGLDVRDLMSGYFALRRDCYERIAPHLRPRGFKILVEILSHAEPGEVVEVGYQFRPRTHGRSKLSYAVALEFLVSLYEIRLGAYLPTTFLRYALVGGAGVIVNLAVLGVLHHLGVADAAALIAGIAVAMLFNYVVNDRFTFVDGASDHGGALRITAFLFFCSIGAFVNFSVASTLHGYGVALGVAACAGILVAIVWNYLTSRSIVWRDRT